MAPHGDHVGDVSRCGSVGVARREAELDAVAGKRGVDAVGHGCDQGTEEGRGGDARRLLVELREAELAVRSMPTKHVELAFSRLHLRDVGVKIANWIGLVALAGRITVRGVR